MSLMVSLVLSFFPRDVLNEIGDLIESVSEGFPSYSYHDNIDWELCKTFYVFNVKCPLFRL